ncbi:CheR family methyltransferase [Pseudomonas abieticivorans]|uniref:CheR family methyltransferase n=1 Tax=Pseudomonas abieticivorans TaxID=2931382 RepID=UPI0020BE79C2|nr:CheR family methyltransferase [Pseudomonas sp. PIA16]
MASSREPSPNAPQRAEPEPSHLAFPIVGIGASAGGLQAVKRFFEHMPSDSGMAFVIIFHLSPDHQSIAGKIIQETTRMTVVQVTERVAIEPNHVYVISPAHTLSMSDGYLNVATPEPRRGGHVAIDLFFRDLADVHKERAFCLVLSGTGSDGAVGLSRIKEQGGITFAQSPDDAEFDGMPQAAIATHMVDLVLPVVEMPQKIIDLWRNSQHIQLPADIDATAAMAPSNEHEAAMAEQLLHEILIQLRAGTGHDFKHYKRATVLRRIERRMQVTAQPDLRAYYQYLLANPAETKALLADMLIGVTNFFRDREAFEALERDVLPLLFSHSDAIGQAREEVRVWSAGSSTGEEAYSLTMLLNDQQLVCGSTAKIQVFATDIDERAVAVGRAGAYPQAIVTDIPPSRLRQYFIKEESVYRVRKEAREKVLFAKHSLLADPPFSQIDLIVCRNLLIYLDRDVQREILQMFHFALNPGGFLFLGSSESADLCPDLFTAVDKKNRIFRARTGIPTARRMPSMPRGGYTRASTSLSAPAVPTPRKLSFADIHQRAIEHTTPSSMVVDSNADVMHMSEGAGRYLRHVAGEMTRNLVSLVLPELRLELRTALFQAHQSGSVVRSRHISLSRDGRHFHVDITAHPYADAETESECVLVLFEETEVDAADTDARSVALSENQVLSSLERDLQRTKLQLQDTIEQSEISSEELKASNEEMQAINEELRSATEELETSKEELQSINEELLTVNSELKTKVEETDKINDYLTNLIASTEIATVFVDRTLRIKWFTPRATDIFSMLPVDTGRSLLDITHRLAYDEMVKDATTVFDTLSTIEREVSSADGRWYIARLLPYRSAENYIDGMVLTFIDITKRREAEEELRLGEERMRLVAENTRDYAIIVEDEQGVITSWNTGAELIFGYPKAEAEGRPMDFLFTLEDRAAGLPHAELANARHNGRVEDERWHIRRDGTRFYCSCEVTSLQGDSVQGFVMIARDLTSHIEIQQQQSQKLADTQNTSHLKDEFFAVMSHELKHPLNLIQLNAEMLRRLPMMHRNGNASRAVETIRDAVTSQARIIDDLLDVARVRTGKLQLKRATVSLVALLQDIYRVLAVDRQGAEVVLQLPDPQAEPLIIDADPTRVEQIIWNLVNNALKFTPPEGQVQLVAERYGDNAKLKVIDNGPGISGEQLGKIFDLFDQGDSPHSAHHREGLGIGLSLVRQLTEAHGGSVEVHSPGEGLGSTFTISLPLSIHAAEAPSSSAPAEMAGRLAGVRILLVDDSPEVLEALTLLLEMEDAQVCPYAEPHKALEAAKGECYDVIISDIGMPGMDGHQLMHALRQLPTSKHTPSIALTGYGTQADINKSGESGFTRHLGKPVAYDDLIAVIEGMRASS